MGCHLGVAQLVARYLGVVEAAGSNPVTQTNTCFGLKAEAGVFLCSADKYANNILTNSQNSGINISII